MSHHIDKTQAKRWFCAEASGNARVFGTAILGSELETGQAVLDTYLTEDELEIYVDSVLVPGAYQEIVENQFLVNGPHTFLGISGKYIPIAPPPPPPPPDLP